MRSRFGRLFIRGAGLLVLIASVASTVFATPPTVVPEIDGSTVATGVGLLSGAALIIKSRRRTN